MVFHHIYCIWKASSHVTFNNVHKETLTWTVPSPAEKGGGWRLCSPVLSTISTTYVVRDEVTTFVNNALPFLSTVILLSHNFKYTVDFGNLLICFLVTTYITNPRFFLFYFTICKTTYVLF